MMTAEYQRAWRAKNPDKVAAYNGKRIGQRTEYNAEWCRRNPHSVYARSRKRTLKKYGLTEEDYQKLNTAQDGRCAICRKRPPLRKTRAGQQYERLDIDHCHNKGRVRGLLCCNCNAILGHARDGVDILAAAIAYVESHQ
jgi:hypothetical protein